MGVPEWPAFRGPDGQGHATATNLPIVAMRGEITSKNSWASPMPIIDGDRVYVHVGADGTAAVKTDRTVLWRQRFGYQPRHGARGSPVVDGDLLMFSCDGSDAAFVIALDKQTGEVKWKTDRERMPQLCS